MTLLAAVILLVIAVAGCGGGGGSTTVTEVTTTQVEDTTGGGGITNGDTGKHVAPDNTTPVPPQGPNVSNLPANAIGCNAHVFVGPKTSCPFALEVADKYKSSGDTEVQAFSPITGKTYTMTCTGSRPTECTGGNDAVVYLDP